MASGVEAASVVRLRQSLVDANLKSEGLESENERLKQELARVNKEREVRDFLMRKVVGSIPGGWYVFFRSRRLSTRPC